MFFLRLFVLLDYKLPEVSGSHSAKSRGCWHFHNENLLQFLAPLKCSGILCIISLVYVGIIIYQPCFSFLLSIRASAHCSRLQLSRFQQCRVVFLQFYCMCKITVAGWVMPVPLLWLKVQRTLIKNFNLLYMELAVILPSSAALCGEDVLCFIL